jgi:hypothetical protein
MHFFRRLFPAKSGLVPLMSLNDSTEATLLDAEDHSQNQLRPAQTLARGFRATDA